MKFEKNPLTINDHIDLLISRGLLIPDKKRCHRYIKHIGYYRLSAYFLPFQQDEDHNFKDSTSFDDILNVYIFDRKLRLLILEVIERIEISLRAQFIDSFCRKYGAHGYTNPEFFNSKYNHDWLISKIEKELKRSNEAFIRHYLNKYSEPPLPPFWMIAQVLTFTELSTLIENILDESIPNEIAISLDVKLPILISWLKNLAQLRNICAHHSRLWNRVFGIKPKTPKKQIESWNGLVFDPFEAVSLNHKLVKIDPKSSLFGQVVILWHWLNKTSNSSSWLLRFERLVDEHQIDYQLMGFGPNWKDSEFWETHII